MPHLPAIRGIFDLRCQRFAVNYYGFTFGALDLQHLRRLQRQGELRKQEF